MCPDGESSTWPFGSQADAQSAEPHQPGPDILLYSPVYNVPFFSGCFIRFSLASFQQFDDDTMLLGGFGNLRAMGLDISTDWGTF